MKRKEIELEGYIVSYRLANGANMSWEVQKRIEKSIKAGEKHGCVILTFPVYCDWRIEKDLFLLDVEMWNSPGSVISEVRFYQVHNTRENVSQKQFPNGFQSWSETHFEVVKEISHQSETCRHKGLDKVFEGGGRCALQSLALELTDKFENLHEGREWDGEFWDVIDVFLIYELRDL